METPRRSDEGEGGGASRNSSPTTPATEPSQARLRHLQRRYRSLFHQSAQEYHGWCRGEIDSQRALSSICHLLDRLQILDRSSSQQDEGGNLGGLAHLPGCIDLLIRKHTMELERVMRLWRSLVQQMKEKTARVEEAAAEAWDIHRSTSSFDTAHRICSPMVGVSTPVRDAANTHNELRMPSPLPEGKLFEPQSPSGRFIDGAEIYLPKDEVRGATWVSGTMSAETAYVAPMTYLQWLEDLSRMLLLEQWRKENLLPRVKFGTDAASEHARSDVRARWSSFSDESFLDRRVVDDMMSAAQVVPAGHHR